MTTEPSPRVRFAPSPSGYLHLGGARTALFSWLWARKHGGQFIVRVEDTDQERSSEDSVWAILEGLRWLGLDWDEGPQVGGAHGPYFQSERRALYRDHAERLVQQGLAYRCYASKEELDAARQAHADSGSKAPFRYPGWWRERRDYPEGKPYVIRFKSPQSGQTGWLDRVKGRIDVPNDTLHDFILLRADGLPLYNFACVVDDLSMGITLVARGDDHLVNTPPQVLLYEALGARPPAFAHLPMILAPNGEKLSKRHAAVNVLDYRTRGYLPSGVLNYLARLGWSHGDQEIFTLPELVDKFDFARVGSTAGKYDPKKFAYVQAEHLRALDAAALAEAAAPFVRERGLEVSTSDTRLHTAVLGVQTRATTLVDVAEGVDYIFRDRPVMDEKAARKFLRPEACQTLSKLADKLAELSPFDAATLEPAVHAWLEAQGLALKAVAQPARVALTGRSFSPGIFEVMQVLGKDAVLTRLRAAAEQSP
ncbi:MAG: glutamate--tRNA ligase [Polyangiales bacterium]